MRSLPQALIWETLSHGRWSIVGCFLLGNLVPLATYSALRPFSVDPHIPELLVLQACFLPIIIFQFAMGIVAAQGPMSRLYAAPISSNSIVAWHTLSGAILVGLLTAVSVQLHNTLFHVDWPVWGAVLFSVAAWSAFQFMLCVSSATSIISMAIAGTPTVALFLWLRGRYGPLFSTPKHNWSEVSVSELLTLIPLVVICYGCTVFTVNRARCGEQMPSLGIWIWLVRTWDKLTSRHNEPPPFRSAADAQFWYEWHQKGLALPILIGALLCFVGIVWATSFLLEERLHQLHQGVLYCGSILTLLAVGGGFVLGLAMDTLPVGRREQQLDDLISNRPFESMGQFQASRPFTDSDFAKVILKTAARSGLIAWSMWFAVFICCLILMYLANQFPDSIFPSKIGFWYLPLTAIGTWIAIANATSINLSGRGATVFLTCITLAISFVLVSIIVEQCFSHSIAERISQIGIAVCCAIVVVATIYAFYKAHRKSKLGWKALFIAASLSLGMAGAAMLLCPIPLNVPIFAIILAAGALISMPVATTPLAIAWNRHR